MSSHPLSQAVLVVTSIAAPNAVLKSLAAGAAEHHMPFIVIGDSKSPATFELAGCDFYSLSRQRELPFQYAQLCHERSYARKNIGYLVGIQKGARFVVETDDDNFPCPPFWLDREETVTGDHVQSPGWLNAYRYFSDINIYPRGFPLEHVLPSGTASLPARGARRSMRCAIQQGLADRNPDVDAIYRMLFPLPVDFQPGDPLILGDDTWCPFNSQNTTTFAEAFPLLYLPTFCSFRMTDIWRSFVAQRIAWTCGWNISFHQSTVYQERNEHSLLRDFADEVPGYLNNARIGRTLQELDLSPGASAIGSNLVRCYEALIRLGVVEPEELPLLTAWLADLSRLQA